MVSSLFCVQQSRYYFGILKLMHRQPGHRSSAKRLVSLALHGKLPPDFIKPCTRQYSRSTQQSDIDSTMTANGYTNFHDYDAFGFDLDHTIAKYKLVTLFNVGYDCVTDFLVSERGYDPVIKRNLPKYRHLIFKGLFLDVRKGNILKLSQDGVILKATHGTRLMTEKEIQGTYGLEKKWELTGTVQSCLRNSPTEYRFFENYFDCPGLVATAQLIDLVDKNEALSVQEKETLYAKAWEDTLAALHNMYNPKNFSAEKGSYFTVVRKDPSRFVEECSAEIRHWLKSLKQAGKIVFLLTSSQIDYASCLMEVCLGKDWPTYFDISLFYGRKPSFFTDNTPFYGLENHEETEVVQELQRNGLYSQGNIAEFNKFLVKETGKEDVRVLYFGDNICSDCYPSKHFAKWGTVLVLEEMDAEGYLCSDGTVPGHEHDAETAAPRKLVQHSSLVTKEETEYLTSEFWGPFLCHRNGQSKPPFKLDTFWGDVVGKYSDIAVPSLEYLAGVPLDHKFDTFRGKEKNSLGFHPGRPSSLLP